MDKQKFPPWMFSLLKIVDIFFPADTLSFINALSIIDKN